MKMKLYRLILQAQAERKSTEKNDNQNRNFERFFFRFKNNKYGHKKIVSIPNFLKNTPNKFGRFQ